MNSVEDYFFTDEEYEIFKGEENQRSIAKEKIEIRKNICKKLHSITIQLLPRFSKKGYDLKLHPYCNKNPELEWSSIRPNMYNHGRVHWIGTRYGRIDDVLMLGYSQDGFRENRDKIAFHQFSCIEIAICEYSVDVGIFHAVPHGSIDRQIMHKNILDENWRRSFIEKIKKIQGYGLRWSISPIVDDLNSEGKDFYFDYEKSEDFISYYKKWDGEGRYSSLLYSFPKYDPRIRKSNIIESCEYIIDLVYPLYDQIKWKGEK